MILQNPSNRNTLTHITGFFFFSYVLKERLPGDKIFLEFFHPPRNIPLPFYAYIGERQP